MLPYDTSRAEFRLLLEQHFAFLYPEQSVELLVEQVEAVFEGFHSVDRFPAAGTSELGSSLWSAEDCLLITYGDSIRRKGTPPLRTLNEFLGNHVKDAISAVHILPFCPFSSDDGFAVIDYAAINPELGTWNDVQEIAGHYDLMADLVINHVSIAQ